MVCVMTSNGMAPGSTSWSLMRKGTSRQDYRIIPLCPKAVVVKDDAVA